MVRSSNPPSNKPKAKAAKTNTTTKTKKAALDFKKIKRRVGRKLPPAKNATSTAILSKAIVLPEQTVAADRTDMAVSRRGLTLRELLLQTSHHNPKFRRAALNGVRDLVLGHPAELRTHRLALVEKLRERICDPDKAVRDALYTLFECVIFRSLKQDIQGPTVTLLMAYIFNAMTHMAVDIRLSAFKFFTLLVHSFPSSFFMHSDKVLDHYMDILRNSQIYLQEKNQLNNILSGLEHCLSLLANEGTDMDDAVTAQNTKTAAEKRLLHAYRETAEVPVGGLGCVAKFEKIENLIPVLVNCFEESMSLFSTIPDATGQSFKILSSILQCLYSASKVLVQNLDTQKQHLASSILVHLRKILEGFPFGLKNDLTNKGDEEFYILNCKITEMFLLLGGWMGPMSYLAGEFLIFIERTLRDMAGVRLSKKKEDNLASLLAYLPELITHVTYDWPDRLLEAFTIAYKECNVESKLLLGYLSCVEEMLLPEKGGPCSAISVHYQIEWVRGFPRVLLQLGDKYLSTKEEVAKEEPAKEESSKKQHHLLMLGNYIKVVFSLLLRVGQTSVSTPLAAEYDTIQLSLVDFFNAKPKGIFMKIPHECQELAVCCLYYFSSLTPPLLKSLSSCCLCHELDPVILLKIIEVLDSAYKASRLQLLDQLGFLLILISRFRANPENASMRTKQDPFRTLSASVFKHLSQMGDGSLLLKILWDALANEMSQNPALPNKRGLMQMVVALDMRLSKVSDSQLHDLAGWVFRFILDSSNYLSRRTSRATESESTENVKYLLKPCIRLFLGSGKLLSLVLDLFNPFILGEDDKSFPMDLACKVRVAISFLLIIHEDVRAQLNEGSVKVVLQNIKNLLELNHLNMAIDEMEELRRECAQLRSRICINL